MPDLSANMHQVEFQDPVTELTTLCRPQAGLEVITWWEGRKRETGSGRDWCQRWCNI